jgi:hypothetical protein
MANLPDVPRLRGREADLFPARALAAWFVISAALWAALGLIAFALGWI